MLKDQQVTSPADDEGETNQAPTVAPVAYGHGQPPFNPDAIPQDLRDVPRWAPYELTFDANKPGKAGKKPLHPAKTNSTKGWVGFDAAVDLWRRAQWLDRNCHGLGFLMTGATEWVALDLDQCFDAEGTLLLWAREILIQVDSYTEVSPSGKGLRIIGKADRPEGWLKDVVVCPEIRKQGSGLEFYWGASARFLTMTGNVFEGRTRFNAVDPEVVMAFVDRYASKSPTSKEKQSTLPTGKVPEVLEEVGLPEGLSARARTFLQDGPEANDDCSARVHDCGKDLQLAGLNPQQAFSVLATNEYTIATALEHRRADYAKALVYLWDHHIVKQDLSGGPASVEDLADLLERDPADKPTPKKQITLPPLIKKEIKKLAQDCDIEVAEFARDIDLLPHQLMRMVEATALFQSNSKYLVVSPEGEYRVFTEPKLLDGLRVTFGGNFYRRDKFFAALVEGAERRGLEGAASAGFIKAREDILDAVLVRHIGIERQCANLTVTVDMFANSASVRRDIDGCAHLTFPHTRFKKGPFDPAVVADFKEHFPLFDRFLELLVGARFAAKRKKAFLWIQAPSDWGKGFLEGVLARHDLVVSMTVPELEKACAGGPVGRTMSEFKRAWVLLFNEFKSAKSDLKGLEQSMSFSPKNLPTCKVPLYLKLFASAESVESLVSKDTGVEDQFANRFCLLQPQGNLNDRPLFDHSTHYYMESLVAYVGRELNRRVDEYLALGPAAAADKGSKVIDRFHDEYGIGNSYTRLSEKIPELCQQHLEWVMHEYLSARAKDERSRSPQERRVLGVSLLKDEDGQQFLYVKEGAALLEQWLEVAFGKAERGKLTWKSEVFKEQLPEIKNRRHNRGVQGFTRCIGPIPPDEELEVADQGEA